MNKKFLTSYAFLFFPLSFVGLPIYLHIANFYANEFGLSLTLIGVLLLLSRFVDVVQDPIIGNFSDFLMQKFGMNRQKIIIFASPFLAFSFFLLFNPPNFSSEFSLSLWFALSLIATYTFFSAISINYFAIAAEVAKDYSTRTKIVSAREFAGLFGILFAAILPTILSLIFEISQEKALSFMAKFVFPISLFLAIFILSKFFKPQKIEKKSTKIDLWQDLKFVISDQKFKILLTVFFLNSVAMSMTASNFLFFVEDVLQVKSKAGGFLALYFLAALLAMPFWNFSSDRFGKKNVWMAAILFSCLSFIWAFFLGAKNSEQFYLICIFSGLTLGADLIIPSSLLADITNKNKDSNAKTTSYFSIWNAAAKTALAGAGGLGYIFLGLSGFRENSQTATNDGLFFVAVTYALIPTLIKLVVVAMLYFSDIDKKPKKL